MDEYLAMTPEMCKENFYLSLTAAEKYVWPASVSVELIFTLLGPYLALIPAVPLALVIVVSIVLMATIILFPIGYAVFAGAIFGIIGLS